MTLRGGETTGRELRTSCSVWSTAGPQEVPAQVFRTFMVKDIYQVAVMKLKIKISQSLIKIQKVGGDRFESQWEGIWSWRWFGETKTFPAGCVLIKTCSTLCIKTKMVDTESSILTFTNVSSSDSSDSFGSRRVSLVLTWSRWVKMLDAESWHWDHVFKKRKKKSNTNHCLKKLNNNEWLTDVKHDKKTSDCLKRLFIFNWWQSELFHSS